MATTTPPLWVTLVTSSLGGLLGGFLTFVGVMITQHYARHREQAVWAREDAARSYEHRRDAYVAFVKEFTRQWHKYSDAPRGADGQPEAGPIGDLIDPVFDGLVQIQLFGTEEAAELAKVVFNKLGSAIVLGNHVPHAILEPLRSQMRRDLLIPDRPKDDPSSRKN